MEAGTGGSGGMSLQGSSMGRGPSRLSVGRSRVGSSWGMHTAGDRAEVGTSGARGVEMANAGRELDESGYGRSGMGREGSVLPSAADRMIQTPTRLRHSLATSAPHAGPSRPSPLAASHPMGTISSGSDTDRTLSNGRAAPSGSRPSSRDPYTSEELQDDMDEPGQVHLLALSLATAVPMTRFNSLPVLTMRELEAMREKDGELGIERGGDWAWVSSGPADLSDGLDGVQGLDGPRTAGPVMAPAALRQRHKEDAVVNNGMPAGSWGGNVGEGGSSVASDSSLTDTTALTSSINPFGTVSHAPHLKLSHTRFTGFSDPFAQRGDAIQGRGVGSEKTSDVGVDTYITPKAPDQARAEAQQYPRNSQLSEGRRHTYGTHTSYGRHTPTSTAEDYTYSSVSSARRMSAAPGAAPIDGSDTHTDGTRSMRVTDARRPSLPAAVGRHGRNASLNVVGRSGINSGGHTPIRISEEGGGLRQSEYHRAQPPQESPKGTRQRMASIDRPRILRYKTSPARFTGLGLNIVVNGTVAGAGAPSGSTATTGQGAGPASSYSIESESEQGLSAAERRARRLARMRARTPQDSPRGGRKSGSVDAGYGPSMADSIDGIATPLSANPASASPSGPVSRLGSWSRVGVIDRLELHDVQVSLPSSSIGDDRRDSEGCTPSISRGSISPRGSLSSASDAWSALMSASLDGDTTVNVGVDPDTPVPHSMAVMDGNAHGLSAISQARAPKNVDAGISLRSVLLLSSTRGMSLPEVTGRSRQDSVYAPFASNEEAVIHSSGRNRFDSLDSALPRLFARSSLGSWADSGLYTRNDAVADETSGGAGTGKSKGKGKARGSVFDAFSFGAWDASARFETFPRRGSAVTVSLNAGSGLLGRRESESREEEVKKEWYERRGSWAEGWNGPS